MHRNITICFFFLFQLPVFTISDSYRCCCQSLYWTRGCLTCPRPSPISTLLQGLPSSIAWLLTLDQLFIRPVPALRSPDRLSRYITNVGNTSDSAPLHQLITRIGANAVNSFQRKYTSALYDGAECFASEPFAGHGPMALPTTESFVDHYTRCRARYIEALHLLQLHLGQSSQSEQAVEQSGQWPRITALVVFRCLASNSPIVLPDNWKGVLYRSSYLCWRCSMFKDCFYFSLIVFMRSSGELQNEGCAEMHTDWLLIQVGSRVLNV